MLPVLDGPWRIHLPGPVASRGYVDLTLEVLGPHAGVSFDDSGIDMVVHLGPLSDDDKFRYKRERPSHFPTPVASFIAILADQDPEGQAVPFFIHDRAYDIDALARRLAG